MRNTCREVVPIESQCGANAGFDVVSSIERLLATLPREDLRGLTRIVVHEAGGGKNPGIAGIYVDGRGPDLPRIEIMLDVVYNGRRWPRWVPWLRDVLLARTLFHEVGHHKERYGVHGIAKRHREQFAQQYAVEATKRAFARGLRRLRLFQRPLRAISSILKRHG